MNSRRFVGMRNYVKIFTDDPLFFQAVFNTVRVILFTIPLQIIIGLLIAILLDSLGKSRRVFQTLNFLPYITTPIAIGFVFSFLFDWNVGTVNVILQELHLIKENINWLGSKSWAPVVVVIMVVWRHFGYYMVLYLSGLASIPDELYEAAMVDGTNPVQRFFRITLPMLRHITVFVIINSFISGFQLFDEPFRLFTGVTGQGTIGGPGRSMLTMMWYFYDTAFQNNSRYGYGAAIAFSLCLIIAVIALFNVKILNRKED
jgi:ABC-type sugar transport system permease subunit